MKIDLAQLEFIDKNLRQIALGIEQRFGFSPVITSLYRIDDPGVHGQIPLRGLDIRMRDTEIAQIIADYINSQWLYDPSRPDKRCAIPHGDGANFHLHLQTHKNTVRA